MLLAKLRRGASRVVSGHGWLPLASLQRHASALEGRSSPLTECGTSTFSSTECGSATFAGEHFSLPRAVAGDDNLCPLLSRTRGRVTFSCPESQGTDSDHHCDVRQSPSGSFTSCSVLSPSYHPAGMGASCAISHAAGTGKCPPRHETQICGSSGLRRHRWACSQSSPYTGSTRQDWRTCSTQAETPASSSQGSSFPGLKTQAGASAPNSAVLGFIQQSPSTALSQLGSGSQSSSADVPPPPASLAVSAASSSDVAAALDATIPRPADATAVNGGEQDAFASAPGSTGSDLSSQPTKKASRGRRTKVPLVTEERSSRSTDEVAGKPRNTRHKPSPLTTRRGEPLACPLWDNLMNKIKAKPLMGHQERSEDEVLQALTVLGLPYERAAKLIDQKKGPLRHLRLEGLIELLDLYQEYGVSTGHVLSLLKSVPESFNRDAATLRQILDFLLTLGVTKLGAVLVGSSAANLNLDDNLRPKATFFSSLGAGSVRRLVEKAPILLGLKLSRLQDCAQVLRTALGEEGCVSLLEKNPVVLTCSAGDMDVLFRVLQERYQLGPDMLATLLSRVTRFPKTTKDRMEATLDLLESVVGRENVFDVLNREPQVLFGDTTTIQNLLMLMTPATVRDILLTNPCILLSDWSKSIEPALSYVVERCGVSYEEAVRAKVFVRSLENCVKPRVEFVLSQGMVFVPAEQAHRKKGRQPRSAGWSLATVVQRPLKRFQTRFPGYTGG